MIRMIGQQEYVLAQRIRAVMDGIRPLWRSPVLLSDWNGIKRKWRLNLKSAFLFTHKNLFHKFFVHCHFSSIF